MKKTWNHKHLSGNKARIKAVEDQLFSANVLVWQLAIKSSANFSKRKPNDNETQSVLVQAREKHWAKWMYNFTMKTVSVNRFSSTRKLNHRLFQIRRFGPCRSLDIWRKKRSSQCCSKGHVSKQRFCAMWHETADCLRGKIWRVFNELSEKLVFYHHCFFLDLSLQDRWI